MRGKAEQCTSSFEAPEVLLNLEYNKAMLCFKSTSSGSAMSRRPEQPSLPLITVRTAVGIRCYFQQQS